MAQKVLYLLLLIGAALCGIGVVLIFSHQTCYAQTPYYGPTSPVSGVIPVEIQIYDDPELGGVAIEEVIFDGRQIPLKPSGIRGFRGGGNFKLAPGSYDLIWTVSRSGSGWPRTARQKHKVRIQQNDVWVQISIHGEQVTVL